LWKLMSSPDLATRKDYYKGNRTRQLRAFVYTVKLGTLTRAAAALQLSQPSVSLQIQALERDLGTRLLERTRRRVTVTDAGEALYELARPLLDGWESLERDFQARLQVRPADTLTIAAGTTVIQYLLPALVHAFRQERPDAQLRLVNASSDDVLQRLRAHEADFAIGSLLDVPADISYTPVYRFNPMLIVPHGHPLAGRDKLRLQDLSPHGLILPPRRSTTWRQVDLVFQHQHVPYNVALEIDGWDVIKQYVAMGLGISIVTGACLTAADHERLATHNLRAHFPQRSYGVIARKGGRASPVARAFIDLMRPGRAMP
jgi:DNA-binding transcriptional LysR family regulator